jgi:hypothetical protein
VTPGEWRHFARKARSEAVDLRRMSAETDIHHWKTKWLNDAEKRDETADWYEVQASRDEIEVEYSVDQPIREAAE